LRAVVCRPTYVLCESSWASFFILMNRGDDILQVLGTANVKSTSAAAALGPYSVVSKNGTMISFSSRPGNPFAVYAYSVPALVDS
jgi:hypothetical protein